MRTLWSLCLAACVGLALTAGRSNASEGFDDVAKLAKSGIAEDVLVAYVQASPIAYELTVDEILFLNDLGVTSKSIQEILNHGRDLRAGKDPIVTETPIINNDAQISADEQIGTAVNLNNFNDNATKPIWVDPNTGVDANTGYISPLTGKVSYTPEVVREREIVRETVYVPTPVVAQAECTVSHFYEALTPYGTWVNLDGSWCWQPSVACGDTEWRPYGNRGHWVWTDSGWCWESEYSWGWAPFHYGRWWRAPGYGWMWRPDTTWGPAWVNWRQNDSHWGWAPLPPAARFDHGGSGVSVGFHFGGKHWGVNVGLDFGLGERDYCFVPQDRFCERNVYSHFVARDQRAQFFGNTTVIQNNIIIQNNNIFVNGPNYRTYEQRSGRQLRQVRIGDSEVVVGQTLGRSSSVYDPNAGTLKFYRPRVTSAVALETPAEIAARQVALNAGKTRPSADPRVLAAAARADELRERNFATQDARRQESLTRQSAVIEEVAARRSDNEQHRLNTLMAQANTAEDRAAFAAKAAVEKQRAEEARLQKVALEKQAAEQRRLAAELAAEQNRVAHAKANAESARQAEAAKAELIAQREAREKANRDAALLAEKAAADQRARIAAINAANKNNAEAKAQAAAAEAQAHLEAQRLAREAARKKQEEMAAIQKAQIEAAKAARLKANQDQPPVKGPTRNVQDPINQPKTNVIVPNPNVQNPNVQNPNVQTPKNPLVDRTAERAAEKAAREAAQQAAERAAAEKAAANKADIAAAKAAREAAMEAQRLKNEAAQQAAERAAAEKAAANKAERAADRAQNEAERAAREKAAADRAAALKAEREKNKVIVPPTQPTQPTVRQPVNPKTGQTYDPNDPNDPNNPINTRTKKKN